MKDLYTFDRDLEAAQHTYAEVRTCICVSVPLGSFTFFKSDSIGLRFISLFLVTKLHTWVLGMYANLPPK
jgi:hypothetical protein